MNAAKIDYSNGTGVFYSNEELSGCLMLDLKRSLPVKRIKVRIKGKGAVRWTESASDDNSTGDTYSANETYVDDYVDILNQESQMTLDAGNHTLYFTYLLPPLLPATYKTTAGRIYYSCEAIVESAAWHSLFSHKRKIKKPFVIIPNIILDTLPNASSMITRQTNKVLYTCCWSLGMLKVSLCIDRGAYVPGDRIILNVEISNQTSAHLNYLHAKLKRKVICKVRKRTFNSENVVISGCRCTSSVSPYENYVWKNAQIPVPYTPPTDLGGCQIISVTYKLKIVISTQWNCASSGLTFKIPITIGALPRNAAHLYHNEIELQKFLQLSSVINSQPVQINNGLPKPEMHLW